MRSLERQKHSVTPRRFTLTDMLFLPSRTGYFYPHGQVIFTLNGRGRLEATGL